MPTEEISTRDLMEQNLRKANEELSRIDPSDAAKRKAKTEEITALTTALNSMDQTEQNRLNNNAKNSIEEDKLRIEAERVENDKKRIKLGWGQLGIGILGGFLLKTWAYMLSEHFQEDRPMGQFSDKLYDKYTQFREKY